MKIMTPYEQIQAAMREVEGTTELRLVLGRSHTYDAREVDACFAKIRKALAEESQAESRAEKYLCEDKGRTT